MQAQIIKEKIDDKKMNMYQWIIIGICICLNIIDGFDVLVMAFTAASVASDWRLSGAEVGLLLSSGLFGMGLGSIFLAPWADIIGRRTIILISLTIVSFAMIMSSFSATFWQLGALRFITGIGIGGILACSNVLTSEYASAKWRSLAISLQSAGYGLGAVGGGVASMYLIESYSWHAVFLFGGIVSTIFIIIAALFLPESMSYLLLHQPKNTLAKLQKISRNMQLPEITTLPTKTKAITKPHSTLMSLFEGDLKQSTLYIWAAFFCVMFGFYCILSWTPKLLIGAGMTPDQGITVSIWMNVGSMFGAVLIGYLGTRFNIKSVHIVFLIITSALTICFAQSLTNLHIAIIIAFGLGTVVNGSVAGLYAITPTLYDTNNRASGVGSAIGIGRIGSILSPLTIGILLDAQWSPVHLFYLNAIVFIIAAVIIIKLRKQQSAQQLPTLQNAT